MRGIAWTMSCLILGNGVMRRRPQCVDSLGALTELR
jgi:hypothetical protein